MGRTTRRVVITGIGLVTPLGNDRPSNLEALRCGRSGIATISRFDPSEFPSRMAGEVRGFDPLAWVERKELKKMDPFILFALAAAREALEDAGLQLDGSMAERSGVVLGVGMGGIETLDEGIGIFHAEGVRRVSPFLIPRLTANMAPAHVAIRHNLRGVNYALSSACASGGHAVGEAARLIRDGYQDVVVAGGSEAGVNRLCAAGFGAMRALSTRNEDPAGASRPFERSRDGFVLAEGAALLVLEEMASAQERGAGMYAEIVGYAATSDAHHITMPSPGGEGAARCMREALMDARVGVGEVDFINAHGTSTPQNDINETLAIRSVFGPHADRLAVSATKSMTGHALGAAGAMEAAFTALSLHEQVLFPTINYKDPDPACDLDYVPNVAREAELRIALSNSFGFGGANATLVMRRIE